MGVAIWAAVGVAAGVGVGAGVGVAGSCSQDMTTRDSSSAAAIKRTLISLPFI